MNLLSQQDALQQQDEQEQHPVACQAIDQKGRLFTLRLRSFIGHGRLGRFFHGEMNRQRKGRRVAVGIIRCDGERSREIAGYSVTGYSAGPVSNACVQLHARICDCERFQNQYAILSGGQYERGLTLAILQLDELSLGFLYRRFAPDCFDQVRFH